MQQPQAPVAVQHRQQTLVTAACSLLRERAGQPRGWRGQTVANWRPVQVCCHLTLVNWRPVPGWRGRVGGASRT